MMCRWQSLNRSLERVTAVHDGGGPPAGRGDPLAVAPRGDHGGIALEAVTDVGDQQGWGCTQALPDQAPLVPQPDSALIAVPEPDVAAGPTATVPRPAGAAGNAPAAAEACGAQEAAGGGAPDQAAAHVQQAPERNTDAGGEAARKVDDTECVVSDTDEDEDWRTAVPAQEQVAPDQVLHSSSCTAKAAETADNGIEKCGALDASDDDSGSQVRSNRQLRALWLLPLSSPPIYGLHDGWTSPAQLLSCAALSPQYHTYNVVVDNIMGLPQRLQVWFEVSAHTGRVHFHGAPDGSAPEGLSLPMELLQVRSIRPAQQLVYPKSALEQRFPLGWRGCPAKSRMSHSDIQVVKTSMPCLADGG